MEHDRPLPTAGQDLFSKLSFQSLSGLLNPQPAALKPKESQPKPTTVPSATNEATNNPGNKDFTPSFMKNPFHHIAKKSSRQSPTSTEAYRNGNRQVGRTANQSPNSQPGVRIRRIVGSDDSDRRVANPFGSSSRAAVSTPNTEVRPNANSSWGWSNPHARRQTASNVIRNPHLVGSAASSTTLTHVNAAGEAHMVDVGHKMATRRTAVAYATVRFSKKEAWDMVKANQIAKGDVLSTARIAGIMAAKRTAELIPLCHPIALSKVEMDLQLIERPTVKKPYIIQIQAVVDCTGQTGVEMEALTAVTVAGLTVYDMCKAVDKRMIIADGRLVYKTGGKTGDFVDQAWKANHGYDDLVRRGLLLSTTASTQHQQETRPRPRIVAQETWRATD